MSTTIRGVALALACALVGTTTVLAAPAQAEITVTMDRNLENEKDFKKVTVWHGEKRVRLKSRVFSPKSMPEWVYHAVDTHGDRRPDFLVNVIVKNEVDPAPYVHIERIVSWPPREWPWKVEGEGVDCGLHFARKREKGAVLKMVAGRGCFRTEGAMPTRLRVNTFAGYLEFEQSYDPVPARRAYGAWVTSD